MISAFLLDSIFLSGKSELSATRGTFNRAAAQNTKYQLLPRFIHVASTGGPCSHAAQLLPDLAANSATKEIDNHSAPLQSS
jgi:hypothetical protein